MRKISLVGVLVGSAIDVVLSSVLVIFIMSGVISVFDTHPDQYAQLAAHAMLNDWRLFFMTFVSRSACSILGGYIAARIAKRAELLNGALASLLCVALEIKVLLTGASAFPLWVHLSSIVMSPALALLGGYLCLRGKRVPSSA